MLHGFSVTVPVSDGLLKYATKPLKLIRPICVSFVSLVFSSLYLTMVPSCFALPAITSSELLVDGSTAACTSGGIEGRAFTASCDIEARAFTASFASHSN